MAYWKAHNPRWFAILGGIPYFTEQELAAIVPGDIVEIQGRLHSVVETPTATREWIQGVIGGQISFTVDSGGARDLQNHFTLYHGSPEGINMATYYRRRH